MGEGLTSKVLERRRPMLLNRAADWDELGERGKGTAGEVVARRADHDRRPRDRRHQHPEHDAGGAIRRGGRTAALDDCRQRRRRDPERSPVRRDATSRRGDGGARRGRARGVRHARPLRRAREDRRPRARRCSRADTSAVFLPQPDGDELHATVALGTHGGASSSPTRSPVARECSATSPPTGRAELINSTHGRQPIASPFPAPPKDEDDRLMAAPLAIRGEVAGVLVVWRFRGLRALHGGRPQLPDRPLAAGGDRARERAAVRRCRRVASGRRSRRTRRRAASWPP